MDSRGSNRQTSRHALYECVFPPWNPTERGETTCHNSTHIFIPPFLSHSPSSPCLRYLSQCVHTSCTIMTPFFLTHWLTPRSASF